MRVTGDGDDLALAEWTSTTRLATAEVRGTGEAETEFSLPYRGTRLRGDALRTAAGHLGRAPA